MDPFSQNDLSKREANGDNPHLLINCTLTTTTAGVSY